MLKRKQNQKQNKKEATGKKMDPKEKQMKEETAGKAAETAEKTAEAADRAAETAEKTAEAAEQAEKATANADQEEKKDAHADGASAEDKLKQQNAELTDRLKRNMAEFDNFRKRTEKEKSARFELGARSVIEKLLPVIDNFERGLGTLSEEQKEEAFASGMDKVYKQLDGLLKDMGVEPIEAVGKPFDPNFHNAVMHVDDETAGDNVVVEEFQKGYTYNGAVVRYSMVKVAN